MVTGKMPWQGFHGNAIMFQVGSGKRPDIPLKLSPVCRDFLYHCLEPNSQKRWTVVQLLDHDWVKIPADDATGPGSGSGSGTGPGSRTGLGLGSGSGGTR